MVLYTAERVWKLNSRCDNTTYGLFNNLNPANSVSRKYIPELMNKFWKTGSGKLKMNLLRSKSGKQSYGIYSFGSHHYEIN